MKRYRTSSEEQTRRLGARLGRTLARPCLLLLRGELGAGKTILAKGLCQGLGVEDPSVVHSPTFSLVNRYHSPKGPIFHVDLYRLEEAKEQYSAGLEEVLDDPQAAVIVEWGEKLAIPGEPPIDIAIEVEGRGSRNIVVK